MIKSTSVRSEDWSYVVDHGRSLGLSRVGDGTASLESQQGVAGGGVVRHVRGLDLLHPIERVPAAGGCGVSG